MDKFFPEALVAPNLMVGGTDSRFYYEISDNVYRFAPFHLNDGNVNSIHGINERISKNDFESAIQFYAQLIKNSSE